MSEDNSEVWKQFSGSAMANVCVLVIWMIYKFIDTHCKHTRCSSNTKCCKCQVDNDELKRQQTKRRDAIRSKESVQELQTPDNQKVRTRHITSV
jgi:amino acid permease